MNLFKSDKPNNEVKRTDQILSDLPRGVEGRRKKDSWLPRQYFEDPDTIAKESPFNKGTGEIFLGVVNGTTEKNLREEGWYEFLTQGGDMIGSNDDRHILTIAGSRTGKGRCAAIPNLLTYGGSVLSIDPKGDHASITAKHRAEVLGQDICIVDPFEITSKEVHEYIKRFNPLSILQIHSERIVEDAGLIAGALVIPDTKERHWSDSAQAFLEGVILHVVTDERYREPDKHLPMVADLIFCKFMPLDNLLDEMMENNFLDNRIIAAATMLNEKGKSEKLSVLSTLRRNIKFLDYDPIRWILSQNDFEFEDLKRNKLTVYICLPVMRMSTCAPLLRLSVNMTLAAMEKEKRRPEYPVLMILDEFPILGFMQELQTAIGFIAGLGVKLWVFIQDLSQLKDLYPQRYETFIGNAGVVQCFGNSENSTTEFISKKLGQTTLTVTTQNPVTKDSRNQQGATGISFQQQVRPLLSPEEIAQYFARDDYFCRQLVMQPGKRAWILQRVCYDCSLPRFCEP